MVERLVDHGPLTLGMGIGRSPAATAPTIAGAEGMPPATRRTRTAATAAIVPTRTVVIASRTLLVSAASPRIPRLPVRLVTVGFGPVTETAIGTGFTAMRAHMGFRGMGGRFVCGRSRFGGTRGREGVAQLREYFL
jgi:hypothetical protein